MTRMSVIVCGLGVSLTACGDASGPAQLLANLDKWQDRGPNRYTYEFQRGCFCGGAATQAVRISVNNGQVIAVVRVSDGQLVPVSDVNQFFRITIDSLFGILGEAMDGQAAELRITYDPFFGYPRQTFIDYRSNVADDELGLTAQLLVTP